MTKDKILITGGYGFIGSCLIRYLLNEGHTIVGNIDKLTYCSNTESITNDDSLKNYFFYKEDIFDQKKISEIINEFKPNYIIHLAAESHVDRSIDGPEVFMNSNIIGTFNLLNASYQYISNNNLHDNFKFILVSTDEVYGSLNNSEDSFTEESSYAPNSPYSASKASADLLARAWNKTYKFPIIVTNTTNNYGPWQFPEKLIPLTIYKCLNEQKIPIYGSGDQIRDWIYVDDHVSGLIAVIKDGKIGEKYNIGCSNELRNIDVVKDICNVLDSTKPRKNGLYSDLIEFVSDRPGHDFRYSLNSNKIKDLGWKPKYNWNEALKMTIEWYINNPKYLNSDNLKKYSGERLGSIK